MCVLVFIGFSESFQRFAKKVRIKEIWKIRFFSLITKACPIYFLISMKNSKNSEFIFKQRKHILIFPSSSRAEKNYSQKNYKDLILKLRDSRFVSPQHPTNRTSHVLLTLNLFWTVITLFIIPPRHQVCILLCCTHRLLAKQNVREKS